MLGLADKQTSELCKRPDPMSINHVWSTLNLLTDFTSDEKIRSFTKIC